MNEETEIKSGAGDLRIRREGTASEVRIPFGQYMRLVLSLAILFGAISLIALLMEHWALYAAGWVVVVLVGGLAVQRQGRAPLIAAGLIAAFWAVAGYKASRMAWVFPPISWGWPFDWSAWQVRAWIIGFLALAVVLPTGLIAWRYAAEIVDPSGPTAPRKPVDRSTTVWPWTPEPEPAGLTREDVEELLAEMLAQQRETLRVETVRGGDGNGGVRPGGGMDLDDLPYGRQALPRAARRWQAGQMRWSKRELAGLSGIGDTKARKLLDAMVSRGFLAYPDGNKNHPEGAKPTAKGRALLNGLLSRE